MSDTPETDKIVKDSKHIKFLEEDHWSLNGKFTYTHPIVCLCRKLEQQRDRLAEALQRIRDGYGGQVASPNCCADCDYLLPIDEALQSLTPNEL
jgi:hypothetical protein